jgi:hypothetical protein
MKKSVLAFAAILFVAITAFAADKPATTFAGEIMDSQCAAMGNHEMMMKDATGTNTKAKADCTKACIKAGGKYVLYDGAAKKVYSLSDQTKPAAFAGQNVTVTGTLDGTTIKVASIAKAN